MTLHQTKSIYIFLPIFIYVILLSCAETKGEDSIKTESLKKSLVPSASSLQHSTDKKMKYVDIAYCMGQYEPADHEDFLKIPEKYADRSGLYLRDTVLNAFIEMHAAAEKENVNLIIRSATRNFNYQKGIWEKKWNGSTLLSDGTNVKKDILHPRDKALKILEYSSMPGTSRHHWGTDIDLNAFTNEYFEKGEGLRIYEWLQNHAASYGFCQPYTAKGPLRPNGYSEEKWHWTFQPLSQDITNFAERNLKNEMISGFQGSETAVEIDVVTNYVLGINTTCRH